MNVYHLDYETYSRAKLDKVGTYRYAEDPSTLILLAAIARNDELPVQWTCIDGEENEEALDLLWEAAASGAPIYAHNAPFEMAISRNLWKQTFNCDPPEIEQWRCTMAMARRAAMPSDLGQLEAALINEKLAYTGRKKGKEAPGKRLIKIFSQPKATGKLKGQRIMPDAEGVVTFLGERITIHQAWEKFCEYNRQDVVKEQKCLQSLAGFELKGAVLRQFQFDARMNDRGLPVNRDALKKALHLTAAASETEVKFCNKLCGLNPTQVKKLLPWLQERGYPGDNLQEETMDAVLENPPETMKPEALEVLKIRSRTAFSAVKKIPSMLNAACKDGRIRGTLMWSGAIRTHRWSGKIIQPQNFKRPPKHLAKDTHEAYRHICEGWDDEMLGMVYGNPVEVVAACIRHFIQSPDCRFLDADYSNIEARITPWLAGETALLQAFRDGRDPYCELAAKIFDVPKAIPTPAECRAKDRDAYKARYQLISGDQRFVGKQGILAAGFQVGGEKFQTMCAKYGRNLDIELCETTIAVYREEHPNIRSMWKAMNMAAVQAIQNPGQLFKVRGRITFGMSRNLPFPALMMRLPSGHHLVYPYPRLKTVWIFQKQKYDSEEAANRAYRWARKNNDLEEDDWVWKTQQVTFFGPNPITSQWGRQTTYGGKLFENAVQATAGDFISHGAMEAEKAGYEIFLLVHDQALSDYRPEKGHTVEGFREALCTLPLWASDFPLEATCDITPFYTKD